MFIYKNIRLYGKFENEDEDDSSKREMEMG